MADCQRAPGFVGTSTRAIALTLVYLDLFKAEGVPSVRALVLIVGTKPGDPSFSVGLEHVLVPSGSERRRTMRELSLDLVRPD